MAWRLHVAPASLVLRTEPSCPTAKPELTSWNETLRNSSAAEFPKATQLRPLSLVRIILSPTARPVFLSRKATDFRLTTDGPSGRVQNLPPSSVRRMPDPTAMAKLGSTKATA